MKKIKYIQIAHDVGVTHSAVSQWFSGKTKPTIDKAFIMKELHNIPLEAWLDIKSYLENNTKKAKCTSSAVA